MRRSVATTLPRALPRFESGERLDELGERSHDRCAPGHRDTLHELVESFFAGRVELLGHADALRRQGDHLAAAIDRVGPALGEAHLDETRYQSADVALVDGKMCEEGRLWQRSALLRANEQKRVRARDWDRLTTRGRVIG